MPIRYYIILAVQFVASFLISNIVSAQGQSYERHQNIAQQYVDDYINLKFDELAKYYNTESIFQDPTLALIDQSAAQKVTGKIAILEKLKRNFNGVTAPKYKLTTSYQVGDYSVFTGVYDYTQNATAFGGPNVLINFSLKSTTILKVKGEKILEHIEYMDYGSWFEQYKKQKK